MRKQAIHDFVLLLLVACVAFFAGSSAGAARAQDIINGVVASLPDVDGGALDVIQTQVGNTGTDRSNTVWSMRYSRPGEPLWREDIESHYEPAGAYPVFERHMNIIPSDGATAFRPYEVDIAKVAPYTTTWLYQADRWTLSNPHNMRIAQSMEVGQSDAWQQWFGQFAIRRNGPGLFVTNASGSRVALVADGATGAVRMAGPVFIDSPDNNSALYIGGGGLYVGSDGALYWRSRNGTITQIGAP